MIVLLLMTRLTWSWPGRRRMHERAVGDITDFGASVYGVGNGVLQLVVPHLAMCLCSRQRTSISAVNELESTVTRLGRFGSIHCVNANKPEITEFWLQETVKQTIYWNCLLARSDRSLWFASEDTQNPRKPWPIADGHLIVLRHSWSFNICPRQGTPAWITVVE